MRSTGSWLKLAILLLVCLAIVASQAIKDVIGKCNGVGYVAANPNLDTNVATKIDFSEIKSITKLKNGNMVIFDKDFARKYDAATGNVTTLSFNWKGSSEIFKGISGGMICAVGLVYDPRRDQFYSGCGPTVNGVVAIKDGVVRKLINGKGTQTMGDFSTLSVYSVKSLYMDVENDLLHMHTSTSANAQFMTTLNLTSSTAIEQIPISTTTIALSAAIRCSINDTFFLADNNGGKIHYQRADARGVVGTVGTSPSYFFACGRTTDEIYVAASNKIWYCNIVLSTCSIIAGNTVTTSIDGEGTAASFGSIMSIFRLDDYLYINDNTLRRMNLTSPYTVTTFATKNTDTTASTADVYGSLSFAFTVAGFNYGMAVANHTFLALCSLDIFRTFNLETNTSKVLLGPSSITHQYPSSSLHNRASVTYVPSIADDEDNIYSIGLCTSAACNRVLKYTPWPSGDGYEVSVFAGTGATTNIDGNATTATVSVSNAADRIAFQYPYLYISTANIGIRSRNVLTNELKNVLPYTAATSIDGIAPTIARVTTMKGMTLFSNKLVFIETDTKFRSMDLATNMVTSFTRQLTVGSSFTHLAGVDNNTFIYTSGATNTPMYYYYNGTQESTFGCFASCGGCDAFNIPAPVNPQQHNALIAGHSEGSFYAFTTKCVRRFSAVAPSRTPTTTVVSSTSTSVTISVQSDPSSWGGSAPSMLAITWKTPGSPKQRRTFEFGGSFTLDGLQAKTTYRICTSVVTAAGSSPLSCIPATTK